MGREYFVEDEHYYDGSMKWLYIYLDEWLIFMVNVGEYAPMDPSRVFSSKDFRELKQSMGDDVEWSEKEEALYNLLKSLNPNPMGINVNHHEWLEIKAKREKAFKTNPPYWWWTGGRVVQLSVLDFIPEFYLKDAGCFNDDIDTDNGITVFFKEFKDDRTFQIWSPPKMGSYLEDHPS